MSNRKPVVCVFAPVPPPMMGSSLATRMLLESPVAADVDFVHIDARFSADIATMGRASVAKLWRMLAYLWQLVRTCRRREVDYVVLIPAFTSLPFVKDALVIFAVRWCTRSRVLVWGHSNDLLHFAEHASRPMRVLIAAALRRVAHVVVVGDALRRNYTPFVPVERITTIPNALEDRPPTPARHADGELHVLFLSNMVGAKGWRTLLEAAELVCERRSDVRVLFHGAPYESSTEAMRERFARGTAATRVRWEGAVFGDQKLAALAWADVLCLPSRYRTEALPMSILEAMRQGLAVITSRIGAIPEAIVDGAGGIVLDDPNVEAVAAAIERLADAPELVRQMGEFNRQRFLDRFVLARHAHAWSQLLCSLPRRDGGQDAPVSG